MFMNFHYFSWIIIDFYRCSSMFIDFHRFPSFFIVLCWVLWISIDFQTNMLIYIYVYMCMWMLEYMRIYRNIFIYIYIHIYIYIYIQNRNRVLRFLPVGSKARPTPHNEACKLSIWAPGLQNARTTPAQPPAQPPLEAGGQIGKFRNICAPMLFAFHGFSYTFIGFH